MVAAMRVKVEEILVSGADLKLIAANQKKKIYKRGALKPKDLREGDLFVEGGASCDCPATDTVDGRRPSAHYLVMGRKVRQRGGVAEI